MAGGAERCFHFILHNSSFILAGQRPAVGFIGWLGAIAGYFPLALAARI
jgi:hypothetical protein